MHDEWDEKTVVSADVAAQAPSGRKRARLIVLAGGNVGEMYEIAPQLILGRGREADVRLQGDGISRKHAWVRIEGEDLLIMKESDILGILEVTAKKKAAA